MPVRELLPSEVGSHVSCIRAGVDGGAVSAMRALTRNIEELETALLSPALHDCELIKESLCSLCRVIRDSEGIEALAVLASAADPTAHQSALLLLSNISSESLDHQGFQQTRHRLKQVDILSTLLPHIYSSTPEAQLYSLGVLMNSACAGDASEINRLNQADVPARLKTLAANGDKHIQHFARRCVLGYNEALTISTMQRFAKNPFSFSRKLACTINFILRLKSRRVVAASLRRDTAAAVKIQSAIRTKNAKKQMKARKQKSEWQRPSHILHLFPLTSSLVPRHTTPRHLSHTLPIYPVTTHPPPHTPACIHAEHLKELRKEVVEQLRTHMVSVSVKRTFGTPGILCCSCLPLLPLLPWLPLLLP